MRMQGQIMATTPKALLVMEYSSKEKYWIPLSVVDFCDNIDLYCLKRGDDVDLEISDWFQDRMEPHEG